MHLIRGLLVGIELRADVGRMSVALCHLRSFLEKLLAGEFVFGRCWAGLTGLWGVFQGGKTSLVLWQSITWLESINLLACLSEKRDGAKQPRTIPTYFHLLVNRTNKRKERIKKEKKKIN